MSIYVGFPGLPDTKIAWFLWSYCKGLLLPGERKSVESRWPHVVWLQTTCGVCDLHPFSQPFITEDSQLCCWLGLAKGAGPWPGSLRGRV
jgi:hypothetical protein